MTFSLLLRMSGLFAAMFLLGTAACMPAYHYKFRSFFASRLWIKILWWIPIFLVFCVILYGGGLIAWLVVVLLSAQAQRELRRQAYRREKYVALYPVLVIVCLFHLPLFFRHLLPHVAIASLIAICFASVVSDVIAFFAGTYSGRHHLPAFINPGKSYEGVAGQVVGALLGTAVAALLPEVHFSWGLAMVVGSASAVGDIMNSITKRQLGIKDWGDTIPGHGGILDRFASLSLALAAGFWLTIL